MSGGVALVTGAARRVGRAIAVTLAQAGYDIGIHYNHSEADAQETQRLVVSHGRRAALLQADLTDESSVRALPDRAAAELGALTVLVNNAATFERVPLDQLDAAAFQRTFAVNTIAPTLLASAAAPHMRKTGGGRIINLTDISSERPWTGYLAYCASKAALESLTIGLAKSLAPDILVNAIAPGIAEFPESMDDATRKHLIDRVPLRRAGTPEDVAAAVLFLVRDCPYTTGTILRLDGGRSIAW